MGGRSGPSGRRSTLYDGGRRLRSLRSRLPCGARRVAVCSGCVWLCLVADAVQATGDCMQGRGEYGSIVVSAGDDAAGDATRHLRTDRARMKEQRDVQGRPGWTGQTPHTHTRLSTWFYIRLSAGGRQGTQAAGVNGVERGDTVHRHVGGQVVRLAGQYHSVQCAQCASARLPRARQTDCGTVLLSYSGRLCVDGMCVLLERVRSPVLLGACAQGRLSCMNDRHRLRHKGGPKRYIRL